MQGKVIILDVIQTIGLTGTCPKVLKVELIPTS
jgi:hypothetical protein